MTCTKCGNNLPDNAGFCPYCGTQFDAPAVPQNGYAQPAYQPENAAQYYAPPVQEAQSQYESPVQYEAPVANEPKLPKKKSAVGIIFTVVGIILMVGLAGLNVVQYIKAGETAGELADANELIAQMEEEAGELKEENTNLDAELTALKGEYDAVVAQAASAEETIAGYENQIAALESENATLATNVAEYEAQLENSGVALETYALIGEYLSSDYADDYRQYDDFYCGTNMVVVKVGQSTFIDLTLISDEDESSFTYRWDGSTVSVETEPFDTVCPVKITGVGAGYGTIEFVNDQNGSMFEILVIVIE